MRNRCRKKEKIKERKIYGMWAVLQNEKKRIGNEKTGKRD